MKIWGGEEEEKKETITYETTNGWRSPSSAVIRLSGLKWIRRRSKSSASSWALGSKLSNDFFCLKKQNLDYKILEIN